MGSSEPFCTLYTHLLYTHSLVISARHCVASEGEVVEKVAYSLILHGTKLLLYKMFVTLKKLNLKILKQNPSIIASFDFNPLS